ncbi:hypothetical protein [Amycolatopsis sp. NPDC004625]|uniref:hypothetical protein n=1 Tax=Amycolatopsis sp. NPDC004625 TaxID=3154670 RepID=UPI0033B9DC90
MTLKERLQTRKIGAAAAVVAAAAGMVFAAAPAQAAYPTSTFDITYGASYYRGTVTWYNRSVGVVGTFKATGCRRVYASAWAGSTRLDYQSSSTHCDSTAAAPFSLSADVSGGAGEVDLWMTDGTGQALKSAICYRGTSACA